MSPLTQGLNYRSACDADYTQRVIIESQWRSNGLCSMCKAQGPTSLRGPLELADQLN